MEQKALTSVHEALSNATFAEHTVREQVIAFRVEPNLKEVVAAICTRHGTTLSEFLRQCCIGLAEDYRDPARG